MISWNCWKVCCLIQTCVLSLTIRWRASFGKSVHILRCRDIVIALSATWPLKMEVLVMVTTKWLNLLSLMWRTSYVQDFVVFALIWVFNSYYLNPCSYACYSLSKHQESSSVSSDGNLILTFIIGYGWVYKYFWEPEWQAYSPDMLQQI